jgi:creatinine amidohydrolase
MGNGYPDRAEQISYRAIRDFDRTKSICFLPMSALEVHGPHLPLGMDMFMARWMAEETARRFAAAHPDWSVVIYPPLTLGTDELPLPGSMNATQRVVYRALLQHGASLAQAGYGYAVVTNGHGGPRHASAIEAACRRVSRRHGIAMFSPAVVVLHPIITGKRFDRVEELLGRRLSDEERHGLLAGEHAGTWETSFALAENPDLVDSSYRELREDGPPAFRPLQLIGGAVVRLLPGDGEARAKRDEIASSLANSVGWLLNTRRGYGGHQVTYDGDPSVASAEVGHAFREVTAEDCLKVVEEVVSGRLRPEEVRSIASDPAIIQPSFWPRVAATATATVLLAALLARVLRRAAWR